MVDAVCVGCGRTFPTARSLRAHGAFANRTARNPCTVTPEPRRTTAIRYKQRQTEAAGPPTFQCGCGRWFPTWASLVGHSWHPNRREICKPRELTPEELHARRLTWSRRWNRKAKRRRHRVKYGRSWRKDNPTYFVERRKQKFGSTPRAEQPRRTKPEPVPEVAPLFPHIRHGAAVSFWDEELAMDLEQERALAALEGRDPEAAAKAYRSRENAFSRLTVRLSTEGEE